MSFKRMWQLRHPGEEGAGEGDKPDEGNGKGSPASVEDLVGDDKQFKNPEELVEFVSNTKARDEEYQRRLDEGGEKINKLVETVDTLKNSLEAPTPEQQAKDETAATQQLQEAMKKDPMNTLAYMINQGIAAALKPYQAQIAAKEIKEGMAEIKGLPGYKEYEAEITKAIADAPEITTVDQVRAIAHRVIGSRVPDLENNIRKDERKKVLKQLQEQGLAMTEDGGSLDHLTREPQGDKKPEDILIDRINTAGPRDPFAGLD